MYQLPMGVVTLAQVAAQDGWSDAFLSLDSSHRAFLLMIAIACATGIILGALGIVSSTIGSIHRRRAEMDLKREMIERGMSADEMAKVIESAPPPEDATQRWIASWAKGKK